MEAKSKTIEKVNKPEAASAHDVASARQQMTAVPQGMGSTFGIQRAAGNFAMQRMFRNSAAQVQPTTSYGHHTIAGAECSTCHSEQSTSHRSQGTFEPPSAPITVPGSSPAQAHGPSFTFAFDRASRFGHEFSQIPTHPSAAGVIQTKLAINKPGDEYEQEADRVSEQVMRPTDLRTSVSDDQNQARNSLLCKRKRGPSADAVTDAPGVPPVVHDRLNSGGGQTFDPANGNGEASAVTRLMEGAFGLSFAKVIIRADEAAASRAEMLGAKAYTDGNEIGFAAGEFVPGSREGLHTIAHEFAHVAQSLGGTGSRTGTRFGRLSAQGVLTKGNSPTTDTDIIEADADAAAAAVINGQRPNVLHANLTTVARQPKGPAIKVPPRGSFYVAPLKGGGFHYTFNGDDALLWKDRAVTVFTYYLKDAFPGVTDQIAADVAGKLNVKVLDVTDEDIRKYKVMDINVPADVHKTVVTLMKKHHPQFEPTKPQLGDRSLGGEGTGASAEGETASTKKEAEKATKGAGGEEPALTPEEQKLAAELADLMKGAKSEAKVDPKELLQLYKMLKETVTLPLGLKPRGFSFQRER